MTAHDPTPDEHDLGLAHDLPTVLSRRRALGLLSGAGLSAALAPVGSRNGPATNPWARCLPAAAPGRRRSPCPRKTAVRSTRPRAYETSRANIEHTSLKSDIAFRDGYELQMAKVTGSVTKGMRIELKILI